ncbi:sugar dehydrogenase complex small subunit [Aerolutibacter ruishenii]|uniref:D-sorbitol dehydrogenase-like protein n=1 Tax=Aerolutibacter ruishenii TaxID=686800 RepID=A0A562LYU5_9GAMM|nr:sugar dehydrogenase complex small subunit [Lysobacter ruishenii]TWI12780.1 D-sorbitol dehydrogenase-like protein [Lysobacter ruishenii]
MPDPVGDNPHWSHFNAQRRTLLFGALATTSLSVPWVLSRPTDTVATTFVPLSSFLLGRQVLDAGLAGRLHAALAAQYADFPKALQALADLLAKAPIDPLQLQALLDKEHETLAPWPRRIVRAWAIGVVGDGKDARCIAYESALNAVVVADVLKPPTYAYGAYGSWSNPPLSAREIAHG